MFGPIMHFTVGEHSIKMAPIKRDEMELFIADGGMQSHTVTRYLGMQIAPTIDDELEWFDRVRKDSTSRSWGIYVLQEDQWLLIGNTALHNMDGKTFPLAISGCQIFRPEFWGLGIVGCCHRARTMYAFDQLNLSTVRSSVMAGNDASLKALERVGYVRVGLERNQSFRDGRWLHKRNLEMVNPSKEAWCSWWHGEHIPNSFRSARTKTLQALEWAHQNVKLL